MTRMISLLLPFVLITCVACYPPWLFMSSLTDVGPHICKQHDPYLTKLQRRMCIRDPITLELVQTGVNISINECRYQFRNERWNCSTGTKETQKRYGRVIETVPGTREAAFVYAITSAAVTYRVTMACSMGMLGPACGCDPAKMAGKRSQDKKGRSFEYTGCSDHVKYGMKVAKKFLDSMESGQNDVTALVNKHNNKVGRIAVSRFFRRKCRCHGPTTSCVTRTCFDLMQDFRRTGDYLKQRYRDARRVQLGKDNSLVMTSSQSSSSHHRGRGDKEEPPLYYLEKSPDYCHSNPSRGSLGTGGRLCNVSASAENSCDKLCCGRGYTSEQVRVESECDCKFVWCCSVSCRTCVKTYDQHRCRHDNEIEGGGGVAQIANAVATSSSAGAEASAATTTTERHRRRKNGRRRKMNRKHANDDGDTS